MGGESVQPLGECPGVLPSKSLHVAPANRSGCWRVGVRRQKKWDECVILLKTSLKVRLRLNEVAERRLCVGSGHTSHLHVVLFCSSGFQGRGLVVHRRYDPDLHGGLVRRPPPSDNIHLDRHSPFQHQHEQIHRFSVLLGASTGLQDSCMARGITVRDDLRLSPEPV